MYFCSQSSVSCNPIKCNLTIVSDSARLVFLPFWVVFFAWSILIYAVLVIVLSSQNIMVGCCVTTSTGTPKDFQPIRNRSFNKKIWLGRPHRELSHFSIGHSFEPRCFCRLEWCVVYTSSFVSLLFLKYRSCLYIERLATHIAR